MIPATVLTWVAVFLGALSLADGYILFRKRKLLHVAQRIINAGLFFWIATLYGYKITGEPPITVVSLMREIMLVLCVLHGLEILTRWQIVETVGKILNRSKHTNES